MTLHDVISSAGRAFLKAFGSAILIYAPGVLAAQNLNQAYALGVAAMIAAIAAGLTAVQQFVPLLSFAHYVAGLPGEALDSFAQAAVATFVVGWLGVLNAPHDGANWKAITISVLVGAVNAGLRAAQHVVAPAPVPQKRSVHGKAAGHR